MKSLSRGRICSGLAAIAVGVLFNPWTAAWLFSPDGQLETGSSLLILGFDGLLVGIGLLALFASQSVITGLVISVVACLIALTVVDLAARALLKSALYYRPEDIYKNRQPEFPSHSLFESNVSYTGKTWGDLSSMTTRDSLREAREVNFRTDPYGYRNDPWDSTKPLDLIILGDSFGSGIGTTQEEMWDACLRRIYGLNTCNLSMPGNSPWHELLTIKREMPRLQVRPKTTVLWAIFGGNDLDEPCPSILNLPPPNGFWKRFYVSFSTFCRRSPTKQVAERALAGLVAKPRRDSTIVITLPDSRNFLVFSSDLVREQRSLDEVWQHPNLPKLRAVFAEMGSFTRARNINVLVVYVPTKCSVYGWLPEMAELWGNFTVGQRAAFSVALDEMCRENGLQFLDLQPPMVQQARQLYEESGELLWWRDDTHWNGRGHAAAARIVADRLTAVESGTEAVEPRH